MDVESIKDLLEVVESDEMKQLNKAQRKFLKDRFNTYINFEYAEDGGYILKMSESAFGNFEYYLGMEYDKEYILTLIKSDGEVIVEYETMVSELDNIKNLCPMGCEPGDLCPSICPNYKDIERGE
jgi:hypothetical protein